MPVVMAVPYERLEALMEGHIEMFECFGGVSRRRIYDNMRTAVQYGWGKYVRTLNEHFRQLMVHYARQADFCNPGMAIDMCLVE